MWNRDYIEQVDIVMKERSTVAGAVIVCIFHNLIYVVVIALNLPHSAVQFSSLQNIFLSSCHDCPSCWLGMLECHVCTFSFHTDKYEVNMDRY